MRICIFLYIVCTVSTGGSKSHKEVGPLQSIQSAGVLTVAARNSARDRDAHSLDPRGPTNQSNQHDGPLRARIDERLMG